MIKNLQSFIFIGRSGCGKGTQAKLLQTYLKKIDPKRECLYIQTGQKFREFIKGNSETQKISKKIYMEGLLQPEFLTVFTWSEVLVSNFNGNQHLIFDGTPRKYHEAGALDSVFDFYDLPKPFVINLDISQEESKKRLLARKRLDDIPEDIEKRLKWYENDVAPALEFYKNNPDYTLLVINGERKPEEIHRDIAEKINLSQGQ